MYTLSKVSSKQDGDILKTLIVDDELKACQNLRNMLSDYVARPMSFTAFAHNVAEAESIIRTASPDLVFFDIEMPGEHPMDFLQRARPDFDVIFITAYNQYAIEAFRVKAVDYLLKPIDPDELRNAIANLEERRASRLIRKGGINYDDLSQFIQQQQGNRQIMLRDTNHHEVVSFNDLIYIEARKSYCKVVFRVEGRQKAMLMSHSVTEYENMLPSGLFVRIHRSYLVNRMHIRKMERKDQAFAVMTNGDRLPVSRRRYLDLMSLIDTKRQ
jgi:two-component system LytT family response regulator